MKIESHDNLRVYPYADKGFFDVCKEEFYGVRIRTYDSFSYWAIIKTNDNFEPYHIMFFDDKDYFEDWLKKQKPKPEIIYQRGKTNKEE